jgi:hypothetical protein
VDVRLRRGDAIPARGEWVTVAATAHVLIGG